ncbi:hybrid-cluster NAD(P)-dependent oxidoreductase [Solicola gregarius]|uniref:FAD-binding oxidoreductase n=1 Tax=Solicola gregarius TaxID=2908642 RepID=A0AA46YJB8_9ACTN|nr:hybrid-cluster NAD(P)-dependent oxidoreductase [Solicola gregarius]UYM04380.1 FAD-binding oxidoreductase [Solicola gregarius]
MTEMLTRTPAAPDVVGVDEIAQPLACTRIDDITHDIKSFTFALPRPLRFQPGQYVTLTVHVGGRPTERCYTISSPPTRPDTFTITVKRVPGGPVSNWLHDHIAVGDTIDVQGPLGQFSTANHPAARYLFLSAGSGITPLMSMTRAMYDRGEPADVVFVHNARSPRDIVFRRELETMATEPFLSVAAICEEDAPDEAWPGLRGRLTLPTLLRLAPDLYEREILTCGPPPYMSAVREMLRTAGVDPARCHEESFELAPPSRTPAAALDDPPVGHSVELRRSGRTVSCDGATTILEAVSRAGVVVPSSCGEGVCGTCKSTMLAGRVDMQHAGGIRPREIADGKILLCCSTPLEDLVIDA